MEGQSRGPVAAIGDDGDALTVRRPGGGGRGSRPSPGTASAGPPSAGTSQSVGAASGSAPRRSQPRASGRPGAQSNPAIRRAPVGRDSLGRRPSLATGPLSRRDDLQPWFRERRDSERVRHRRPAEIRDTGDPGHQGAVGAEDGEHVALVADHRGGRDHRPVRRPLGHEIGAVVRDLAQAGAVGVREEKPPLRPIASRDDGSGAGARRSARRGAPRRRPRRRAAQEDHPGEGRAHR